MKSLLDEFIKDYPCMPLFIRGDSGFASPELYEVLKDNNYKYDVRLKENAELCRLVEEKTPILYRVTKIYPVDYTVEHSELLYRD